MRNIILFVLMNFICAGYAFSQTRSSNNGGNSAFSDSNKSEAFASSDDVETARKKVVPIVLVDRGVWVADKNMKTSQPAVEKNSVSYRKEFNGLSTGDETIDDYIADSSARYNVDPLLIYAQMYQESGFKLRATSYKGARGLMQLMPATARRFGVIDIYDPKQNIEGGIRYMRWLMDKFDGDEELALAGYNAGEGAVIKYGNQIPPYAETRQYVKKILAHYNSMRSRKRAKL